MSGYDQFRSLRAARTAYRRVRTTKHFILTGVENPRCACCGHPIHDFSGIDSEGKPLHPPGYQSNRCTYNPATKEIRAKHYICAWTGTMAKIVSVGRGT